MAVSYTHLDVYNRQDQTDHQNQKGAENRPANPFPCQTYAGEHPTVERPGAAARRPPKRPITAPSQKGQ